MGNEKMQVNFAPGMTEATLRVILELLNFTKKMSYRYWSLIR